MQAPPQMMVDMKLRHFAWIVMSLVCLSSCGTSDKAKEETAPAQASPEQIKQQQKEADKIIDQQLANVRKKEASTFPCSLFPEQEIEALVGNPLDSGSYAFNHVTDNDRNYKSESCDWSAGFGEGNEAGLWVSLPKHFASGKVECSPGSTNREISGIGDRAWWEYMESFGMGTLRVCSEKAMLEVKVRVKSKEEAAARKIAETMANKVLAQ
jgi:hypothetical protein